MIESSKKQIDEFATDKEIIKVIQESLIAAARGLMLSKPETNEGNYQDLTKPLSKIWNITQLFQGNRPITV